MKTRLLNFLLLAALGVLSSCGPTYQFDESTAVFDNFSGQKAYDHLARIVEFGPRPPGSEGHKKAREYIVAQLEALGWGVKTEKFESRTPLGTIEFFNIRARFSPEKKPAAWDKGVAGLICSHYDSKKFGFEFVGANDGGSSTAALIEIARVAAEKPELASQFELVFFDGEEAFGNNITSTDGLYGSRVYSAQVALEAKESPKTRPKWGVLLDMVGDSDLKIRVGVNVIEPSVAEKLKAEKEGVSVDHAAVTSRRREIGDLLVEAGKEIGHPRKFGISPNFITDDHVPLNTIAGVPTVDMIDFDFEYWHTPGDTLEKISAESLEISGKATLLLVEKFLLGKE